jgi:hypothetical protein
MRRISIAGLMAVVLICGVAAAALREASDTWAGILLVVTLGLLAFALLAIRQRREGPRAFWEGFALFGWGYLALVFGPWFAEQVGSKLPTTQLLGYVHGKLNPAPAAPVLQTLIVPPNSMAWDPDTAVGVDLGFPQGAIRPAQGTVYVDIGSDLQPAPPASPAAQAALAWITLAALGVGNLEHFQRVGQFLFALLAALLGGLLSRRLHHTRPAEP